MSQPGAAKPGDFKDAEAWLAERGVRRETIVVPLTAPPADEGASPPADEGAPPATDEGASPATAREARRLAADALDAAVQRSDEQAATPNRSDPRLEDDVAEAVAFLRRSTAMAPQSEGRLREKLAERDTPSVVIERALERARRERLVDERRRKGHAPARVRRDLRERGFDDALLDVALAGAETEDPEAAAYALAQDKAARCTSLAPEAAFRRVTAHVVRRGYGEGLARKVAREAVFTARDAQRTAGN